MESKKKVRSSRLDRTTRFSGHGITRGQAPVAIDRQSLPVLFLTGGPDDGDPAGAYALAQAEQQPPVPRGEVATSPLGEAGEFAAAHFQGHPGADEVTVSFVGQLHPQPVAALPGLVAEERDRFVQ